MKMIIGLGNPGKKYEKTRHNLGFMVIDELAREWSGRKIRWEEDKKKKILFLKFPKSDARAHEIGSLGEETWLVKPQTYMNNSGMTIKTILGDLGSLGILDNLWVVHDDLDLTVGKLRISRDRGAAGHKGVLSIIEALETSDFVRFRLGIDREHISNPEKFVLEPFLNSEADEIRHLLKKTVMAIEFALEKGVEKAMSRFNG